MDRGSYDEQKYWEEEQKHLDSEDAKAVADTEAEEQAVMDKAQEKIAKLLCDKNNPLMSDTKDHSFWDEKASDSYKIGYYFIADQILALLPLNKPLLLSDDIKGCLDCAREAIVDAICCEDGLDGGAGEKVIRWITDILGDYDEWIKTHSDK